MNLIRIILTVINGVFFLLSMAVFVSGSLVLHEYLYGHSSLLSKYAIAGSVVSMSVGGMVLVLAILNLIGIFTENNRLLYICIGLVIATLGFEIGATTTSFSMQNDSLKLIINWLHSAQTSYVTSSSLSETWDLIQRHVECCGVDSYKDWYEYLTRFNVPDSCCINSTIGCGRDAVIRNNVYTSGCRTAIFEWSMKQQIPLTVFYTVLFLLQIVSVVLILLFL